MKIKKTSELFWLFGVIFVALGVAICSKADLGVSMIAAPAFVVHDAIAPLWSGFSIGTTEYIIQGLMLIVLCIAVRRFNWRYLLAFVVAVIYGYTFDFFSWVLGTAPFDAVWLRYVMLIVGDIVTAFGVACFFHTYMPLQVHELFVAEIASRFNIGINKVKRVFDISLLALSLVLAFTLFGDVATFDWSTIYYTSFHSIGLGTLITTLINSPIIALMSKLIDKISEPTALFPKLEKLLRRDGKKSPTRRQKAVTAALFYSVSLFPLASTIPSPTMYAMSVAPAVMIAVTSAAVDSPTPKPTIRAVTNPTTATQNLREVSLRFQSIFIMLLPLFQLPSVFLCLLICHYNKFSGCRGRQPLRKFRSVRRGRRLRRPEARNAVFLYREHSVKSELTSLYLLFRFLSCTFLKA